MMSPANQAESKDRSEGDGSQQLGPPVAAIGIVGALLILAAIFVASSFGRPELEWYAVSASDPHEAGDTLVGPMVYTIDGRGNGLTFFDFSSGSVVEEPDPLGWDLAFHRFTVLANGGVGFAGVGGIRALGPVSFDSITSVPADGYSVNQETPEPSNPAMIKWYDYSWTSHVLRPKPGVFAVRTADGRYGVFQILSYYCPGAHAGCITLRYRYQGSGGVTFERGKRQDAA